MPLGSYDKLNIDLLAEYLARRIFGLPRAMKASSGRRGREENIQSRLRSLPCWIQSLFFCSTQWITPHEFQAVIGIPIARSTVRNEPLLVDRLTGPHSSPIREGDILNKAKVVLAHGSGRGFRRRRRKDQGNRRSRHKFRIRDIEWQVCRRYE